jgi:hypothetical protein
MRRCFWVALAASALATAAVHAEDVNKLAEASMLVTGTVELNADGSVHDYALDHKDKIPGPVADLIQRNVPSWKFQFSAAPTSLVKESMSLRIVAKVADEKHTTLGIAGVQFEDVKDQGDEYVHSLHRISPNFPQLSLRDRIPGSVYLLVRVGRDGKVADIAAEQVNLRKYIPQANMEVYRQDLAKAAISAVRKWTFSVPTSGKWAQSPYWFVRVPVNFFIPNEMLDVNSGAEYGSWEIYIPGPRLNIPWVTDKRLLAEAADAAPDGSTHQLGASPQLASP